MKKLDRKTLNAAIGLLVVNLVGAALLGTRLFGQANVQVYSPQPDSNVGLWGGRRSLTSGVYYLGVCSNPGGSTVNLCWKYTNNAATASTMVTLPDGTVISGDVVPVSWQSTTYANYPSQL